MTMVEDCWKRVEAVLIRNGIGEAQRRVMAQSFFGGVEAMAGLTQAMASVVRTREEFSEFLDEVFLELQRVREMGVPVRTAAEVAEESGAEAPPKRRVIIG